MNTVAVKRGGVAAKHLRVVADHRAAADGCRYDVSAAEHVYSFFETYLRHSLGSKFAGKPFLLLPWEKEVLGNMFGWNRADGTRRFRRAYIEVPKKNGKSTLAAGVGLYLFLADNEPGAHVYSTATKQEQASQVHGEAIRMARASVALRSIVKINRTTKTITYEDQNAKYAALASDSAGSEGLNIHGIIKDELHAWSDRPFWDALRYASIARAQPLDFTITTAGIYDPTTIGWEMHQKALNIIEGRDDDTEMYAYIRGAALDDDWQLRATHKKANPSYGVTIDPDEIAKSARDARDLPSEENVFRRYRLNQWVEQAIRWISMETWNACGNAVDADSLRGQRCYGGLDLAATTDIAAFVLVFPDAGNAVLPFFWVPDDTAEKREQAQRALYRTWARTGHIEITSGNRIDHAFIRHRINELSKVYDVRQIAYDPWNATQLTTELFEEDGLPMMEFRQGFVTMNAPTKQLEILLAGRELRHGGHPVLTWMAGNVSVKSDPAGNIKPDKSRSMEKIDGIVALIMAIGVMMQGAHSGSVYDERGILSLA